MIRYLLLLFALWTSIYPFPSLAVISVSYGIQSYGKEKIEQVTTDGTVKLEGTTVTGKVVVNGQLKAKGARIGSLQVTGAAILESCMIAEKSSVTGQLAATSCQFFEDLTVCSDKLFFDSCSLSSLHILKTEGHCKQQIISLKGNSKVTGFIIFESGNGEVIADAEADIVGKVIGGKIKKLNN